MDDEEEAAFVDSFFLPGGILDPEEEEHEAPEEPTNQESSLWSGAPPENPWANETRPPLQEEEHVWDTAIPSQLHQPDVAMALPHGINANNSLRVSDPIGNPSYDPNVLAPGPLHGSALMRETMQTKLAEASNGIPLPSHSNAAYPPVQSDLPLASNGPSHFISNNESSSLPFRPPPGFALPSQQPTARIIQQPQQEAPVSPILNNDDDDDDDDDSIRSDSSVPHELYDRESLSASSLSGSSSVMDESSLVTTPNTSSIMDETPNTSTHIDNLDVVSESRNGVEKPKAVTQENREDVAEKSSSQLPEPKAETPEPLSRRPPPSSPVNKSRNRRGGKAKRNKSNHTATKQQQQSTVCVAEKKPQTPSFLEYARASADWTAGLLQHFLSVMQTGIQTTIAFFKSTTKFWVSLLRLCQKAVFALIRVAGILVSFSVLVGQNAFLEATQEWRAVSYFAIVYFTPHAMSLLMNVVVLPHWTPHILSCIILYGLCRPPYKKRFYYYPGSGNPSNLQQVPSHVSTRLQDELQQHQGGTSARSVSLVILRQMRFNLPMVCVLEGFSHEIGTAMTLQGPGRIISAYIILILRLGLVFSPMAWLCGAIQVLMASYLYGVPLIDLIVILVALASVRYAKFLEQCNQAAKDIRAKEK